MLGWRRLSGVAISVQNILLGNGLERDFDGLNLDSTSEAVLAFPHGNSKCEEHILDVVWREVWSPIVEWEESAMILPRTPVTFAHSTVH